MNVNWQLVSILLTSICIYDICHRILDTQQQKPDFQRINIEQPVKAHSPSIANYHLFGKPNSTFSKEKNELLQDNTDLKVVSIINGPKPSIVAEKDGQHIIINSTTNAKDHYSLKSIKKDIAFIQFDNTIYPAKLLSTPITGIRIIEKTSFNNDELTLENDLHTDQVKNLLQSISQEISE